MTAEFIKQEAADLENCLVAHRRFLHQHPGTGFELEDSLQYVKDQLEQMGYQPVRCGKAGIIAMAGENQSGKVFLLRADMDALPIREESGCSFAADNGNMHACGHDMHTAMLLGAARILKNHEKELKGRVKLMFQPAEEIFQGSQDMIQNGLLENPKVDGAMMIHVMAGMAFEPGTLIVSSPGVSAPAADYFEIRVQGVGCHGSMPNTGVDPLNAAAHILIALQEISARELAMNQQAVLTIGTIQGGKAANAIPDQVVMGGSIRTFDEETRSFLKKRLVEIAQGTASVFRAEAKVDFGSGCPTMVNDKQLSEDILDYMKELQGPKKAFSVGKLNSISGGKAASGSAGSEDFAYVSQEVPSVMMALAAGQPEKGYLYPQHHPMVKFDEAALAEGAAAYAYGAIRWLEMQSH